MVKELFNPGDLLFYDKYNEGISNTSHEDSDTTIYFNFEQYVPLGVVVDIDDISSTIKLITPNITPVCLFNIQYCEDKPLLKGMNDKIKESVKFFNKACGGKQSSVKMFIPSIDDITSVIRNISPVLMGFSLFEHYCNRFLYGISPVDILMNDNIGYINGKELYFVIGGFGSEVMNEHMIVNNNWDFEKYKEEQFLRVEYNNSDPDSAYVKFFGKSDMNQEEDAEHFDNYMASLNITCPIMYKSLEELKNWKSFKKLEQFDYYSFAFMSIKID